MKINLGEPAHFHKTRIGVSPVMYTKGRIKGSVRRLAGSKRTKNYTFLITSFFCEKNAYIVNGQRFLDQFWCWFYVIPWQYFFYKLN